MNLTNKQIRDIVKEELREVIKEFKAPEIDVEINPDEEFSAIQPASHAEAQAVLQKQFGIKQ